MSVVPSLARSRRARLTLKKSAAAAHEFDPGPAFQPFRDLCAVYPSTDVYPPADFRTEWGPIFHRGRLDGSARLLVIGQDPAAHETFVRRILVGEAGQRVQGFMAKLGIVTSYVMINTFLYSVASQDGGNKHKSDAQIADYRNRWIDAILTTAKIEAVIALGSLADAAWSQFKKSPFAAAHPKPPYAKIMHPTADAPRPGQSDTSAVTKQLLATWNAGLATLRPAIKTPDVPADAANYGETWKPENLVMIPERDYPPGLPQWMHKLDGWAVRGVPPGTAPPKRRVLSIIVPEGATS
jgi:Uracil DNA glycosylase superfamily